MEIALFLKLSPYPSKNQYNVLAKKCIVYWQSVFFLKLQHLQKNQRKAKWKVSVMVSEEAVGMNDLKE